MFLPGFAAQAYILILFDNFAKDRGFPSGWGFSALVEVSGRRVLFDAGPGRVLTALEAAGVPLRSLDAVVISHLHADHYGGVEEVLAGKPGIPLFVPGKLPPELKAPWQVLSALTEVRSPVEIVPGVWVTAPVGSRLPEMALAVRAPVGVVMLTGCSHPGAAGLAAAVAEAVGSPPTMVVGGLHTVGLRPRKVRQIAEKLKAVGVKRLVGCHCTGKEALKTFREVLGEEVFRGGAGKVISLES